jgi:aminoglycoside N3'-acetyltransferase
MVVLFDQFNLSEDIYKIIFATEQQEEVGKLLIKYMWQNGGEIGKTEMGVFAAQLHEGKLVVREKGRSVLQREVNISYNKRQFYDRILTPMRGMGLIDYDLFRKKYKISDKFNKLMIKIGLLWLREMEKGKKK